MCFYFRVCLVSRFFSWGNVSNHLSPPTPTFLTPYWLVLFLLWPPSLITIRNGNPFDPAARAQTAPARSLAPAVPPLLAIILLYSHMRSLPFVSPCVNVPCFRRCGSAHPPV